MVCYLIPYFNCFDDLILTLRSLEDDSADVVIVDDGSQVSLRSQLDVSQFKSNIHVLELVANQGIEGALNRGLEYIYQQGYRYIARIDCGDLSLPGRIKAQVAAMEADEAIVLCGGWADYVNEEYEYLFTNKVPTDDSSLRKHMFLNNMFIHPAVMIRTDAIKEIGGYPTNRKAAEDYAVFFKLMQLGKVKNLPQSLIRYVVSSTSISSQKRNLQVRNRILVIWDNKACSLHFVYGLLRSCLLLAFPRTVTMKLRSLLR